METSTTTNPLSTVTSSFDNMDSPDFLKLEDLDNSAMDTADAEFDTTSQFATPPPVVVQSKPAKKRKSWGQQLPEPTTTLPPRKRAKTDDEKEQRRIERIKRNRAAAHNSRERKRQEAEVLAVENAQLRTRLEAFEKHFGPLPKHIVLPEVTLCTEEYVASYPRQQLRDHGSYNRSAGTPAPSLIESRGSIATAPSPASPPDLYDYTNSNVEIKQEPHDSPLDALEHSFDNLDGKQQMPTFAPLLDETQHSAAMLCDLPCPSSSCKVAHSSPRPNLTSPSLPISTLILTTLNINFLLAYKTLLLAMWTSSPSRLARMISTSTRASTSTSRTLSSRRASRTLRRSLSATALAQRNAATAVPNRIAMLRRPLVGEVQRARGSEAVAARQESRVSDVTTAFGGQQGRAAREEWEQDEGVGRQDR